ncbi:MAG: pyridoxal phosphate-dependent decarboxylase family protein [Actinomycetota bacterium]
MPEDAADNARLGEALRRLIPALEEFNRFEGPDPTVTHKDRWLSAIDTPLPQLGQGLDAVVETLATSVVPYGLRMGAPGFNGWVTGQPTTSGTVAALAQTVAGPQRFFYHPFNVLEEVRLRWIAQMLGIPGDLQGAFKSGGSIANIVGLAAARQRAFERIGIDAAAKGLPPGYRGRIYASTEVHHVISRAAALLGLGRDCVTAVGCDEHQRIDLTALKETLLEGARAGAVPIAIVATAGTVNTGAVDPISEMSEIAAERDLWFHVDGAYGLFARLDDRVAHLFNGVERADSVAVDPHKWMATPVGCGAAYVRDADLLHRTFTLQPAAYLEGAVGSATQPLQSPWDVFAGEHHNLSLEQSAPPRGVQVWAVLKEIGVRGLRARVDRHLDFARRLADRVRVDDRLQLLSEPTLSICCFRYFREDLDDTELDALNDEIVRSLHDGARFIPSTTRVHGRLAIRPCYINPRTTEAEVEGLVDAVIEIGSKL